MTGSAARATGTTAAASRPSTEPARLTTLDSGSSRHRGNALGALDRPRVLGPAGSRDEDHEHAGISHFLEHLLFKGTDRFSSREIDEAFDAMGAEVNAGTGKETTSVYSRFLDNHLERAFDVLQDMVLRPAYPDIDSERQVVIEEIAMYEDEPQDKVHDVLAGAIFGDHPLGRPIIGRADVVSSVPVPRSPHGTTALRVAEHRACGRGHLEHDRIVELAEAAVGKAGAPPPARLDAPEAAGQVLRFHQETEQYHLRSAAPASRAATSAASRCACSTRSWAARPRRGCSRRCARSAGSYSVYSYASHYADTGQVALYLGTRPDMGRRWT